VGKGFSPEMKRVIRHAAINPQFRFGLEVDLYTRDAIPLIYPDVKYVIKWRKPVPPPGKEDWSKSDPAKLNRARAAISRTFKRLESHGMAEIIRGYHWSGIALTKLGRVWGLSHSRGLGSNKNDLLYVRSTAEVIAGRREMWVCAIQETMETEGLDWVGAVAYLNEGRDEEFHVPKNLSKPSVN
jgi:hypothetical protein